MLKPIIVGIVNVLIPGAGLAILKKWGMAITYFFAIPLFLFISFFTISAMTGAIRQGENGTHISPSIISIVLYLITVCFIVWDAFITPYKIARGEEISKNTILVTALSVIAPGLGFVYLKKWGLAFGYLIWAPLVLTLGGLVFQFITLFLVFIVSHVIPGLANIDSILNNITWFLVCLFVWWDSGSSTYRTAKEMSNADLAVNPI